MNIEQATAMCLKKSIFPKIYEKFRNIFFLWKMALADTILTLDGGVQLFWAAFDLFLAVVPLKVGLGLATNYFWAFQQNNHTSVCQVVVHDYSFEMPKNQICPILMQLLMVPLSRAYQKLPKTIELPHLK